MNPYPPTGEEVSIRDLYLTVRRSSRSILATVVIVGLAAYALAALRPMTFRAEATTAISRAPVTVQQEFGLSFRPEIDITYDTYQTLAFSRGVLERVHTQTSGQGSDSDGFALERLAGSASAPSSLLAVAHRVRHRDAATAAGLATAWAEITIETARALLNENLDTVERITSDSLARADAALERADEDVRVLREGQDGSADAQRLLEAHARLAALDVRADELSRTARAREAEAASLSTRLDEGPDQIVVLAEAPDVPLTLTGALWALEARVEAARAELELVEAQRGVVRDEIRAVTAAVARFEDQLLRRSRAQAAAQRAYDSLLAIEPTVTYVAQLAPTGARVLSDAAVPLRPEPRRALLTAAVAAAAALFVALVLVLLREAVRDPDPAAPARGSAQTAESVARQPG